MILLHKFIGFLRLLGGIQFKRISSPNSPPQGYITLFADEATNTMKVKKSDGTEASLVEGVGSSTNPKVATIGITVGDGINGISTGMKGAVYIPFSGEITEWAILSNDSSNPASGSIEFDILKSTYGNYPTMSSIVGTGTKPNISNSTKGKGTPSNWVTTIVNEGDCLRFDVTNVSSLKRVTLVLKVVKS